MAYGALQDPLGVFNAFDDTSQMLDVTVASVDACRVRGALAHCEGVGVLRCEPLLHAGAACVNAAPRVRLVIGLPLSRYSDVLHRVIDCVPDGEIGHLASMRAHPHRNVAAHAA